MKERFSHPNISVHMPTDRTIAEAVDDDLAYPPFSLVLPSVVSWKPARPQISAVCEQAPCTGGVVRVIRALSAVRQYAMRVENDIFLPYRTMVDNYEDCRGITFLDPGLVIENPECLKVIDNFGAQSGSVISHFTAALLKPGHGQSCDYRLR